MNRTAQIALVLVALALLFGYDNQQRALDRHNTRVFFCNELETIKKGERAELGASLQDTRRYLENVRAGRRKPIPGLTKEDLERAKKRKERRLKELAPDLPRCLSV